MSSEIQVIGRVDRRQAVHPSITERQVSDLVDNFYARVRDNPRLALIFGTQMRSDWDVHLPKMKAFWRSVLLKTGEYKGKPVPAHSRLTGVNADDFQIWLDLFADTTVEIFSPPARPVVLDAANRIATSLWLAMTSDPFAPLPDWSAVNAGKPEIPNSRSKRQAI